MIFVISPHSSSCYFLQFMWPPCGCVSYSCFLGTISPHNNNNNNNNCFDNHSLGNNMGNVFSRLVQLRRWTLEMQPLQHLALCPHSADRKHQVCTLRWRECCHLFAHSKCGRDWGVVRVCPVCGVGSVCCPSWLRVVLLKGIWGGLLCVCSQPGRRASEMILDSARSIKVSSVSSLSYSPSGRPHLSKSERMAQVPDEFFKNGGGRRRQRVPPPTSRLSSL